MKKIPLVKTVEFNASAGGTATFGEQCCEGATKPSKYTDYSGTGSASFTLGIIGIGGKITLPLLIPVPGFGIDVGGEMQAEASLAGGGTLEATVDVTGRDGDCGCLTVTVSGSLSPEVSATLGGNAFLGYLDTSGTPHGFVIKIVGSASVNVEISVTAFEAKFGKDCGDGDAGKVCFTWPVFTFTIGVDVPIPLVPTIDYTFTWDIIGSLGFESQNCF